METMYAIRRTDNELIFGEYSYLVTTGPDDWMDLEEDAVGEEPITYEMVKMSVEVVGTRTVPECRERCGKPGEFWGLCEAHAREDDPETLEEMLAAREATQ